VRQSPFGFAPLADGSSPAAPRPRKAVARCRSSLRTRYWKKSRRVPTYKAEQIAALYREGWGQKAIAKKVHSSVLTVHLFLKTRGLLDKSRPGFNEGGKWVKGPRGKLPHNLCIDPFEFAARLRIEELKSETKHARRTDEDHHWGKHPELFRVRTNARARINQKRYRQSPHTRIALTARLRAWYTIKRQGSKKLASWTRDFLVCPKAEFISYLERQFTPEMEWTNYGAAWEMDHRIPCAAFDLTDLEEQRRCFHYTNIRPLNVTANRKKNDKRILPQTHLRWTGGT